MLSDSWRRTASVTDQPGAPWVGRLFEDNAHSSRDSRQNPETDGGRATILAPDRCFAQRQSDHRIISPCGTWRLFYLCWCFITSVLKVTIFILLIMNKFETCKYAVKVFIIKEYNKSIMKHHIYFRDCWISKKFQNILCDWGMRHSYIL